MRIHFEILEFIDSVPHYLRAFIKIDREIDVVFKPADTSFSLF